MEIHYVCPNSQCPVIVEQKGAPYVLTLDMDLVMDEKNLAQMFCPHCKARLSCQTVEA